MAQNTVPKTSPADFLSFPELLLDRFSRQITGFLDRKLERRFYACCGFSDPDCTDLATIHLIETEEDLCPYHFEKRLREL